MLKIILNHLVQRSATMTTMTKITKNFDHNRLDIIARIIARIIAPVYIHLKIKKLFVRTETRLKKSQKSSAHMSIYILYIRFHYNSY